MRIKELRKSLAKKILKVINLSPSKLAAEDVYINSGTAIPTKFDIESTPYLVEVMDAALDRAIDTIVLMAASRSGKSKALVEGMINYAVRVISASILLLFSTGKKAKNYKKDDLDKFLENSKGINSLLTNRSIDNNIDYIKFKNDSRLQLDSATTSALSASGYTYVIFTDYDRAEDTVGDEGSKYDLARQRIQNSGSRAKLIVESSPSRSCFEQPELFGHEMVTSKINGGIATIFNQSDRRVWHFNCFECGKWFAPSFDKFQYTVDKNNQAHNITMNCPFCGHGHEQRDKIKLNKNGKYFREGELHDGIIKEGEGVRSRIAGFHFQGSVAAFQTWKALIDKYLKAQKLFERTGDESQLKTFFNTNEGVNYVTQSSSEYIDSHDLIEMAHTYERGVVPQEAKILLACVDVQCGKNGRFVVQMIAYGDNFKKWIIDRFDIRINNEQDNVRPETKVEDWYLLEEQVIKRTYPIQNDEQGRTMRPFCCLIDSGGLGSKQFKNKKRISTTSNAYMFVNEMKRKKLGHLVQLTKGASSDFEGFIKKEIPKNTKTGVKPPELMLISTNSVKNIVAASFERSSESDFNYTYFPLWTTKVDPDNPHWWFNELTAEYKDEHGNWQCRDKVRNEAFDQLVQGAAKMIDLGLLESDADWKKIKYQQAIARDGEHQFIKQQTIMRLA